DLAVERGKREQNVQREPTEGSAGIELLRDRDKAHAALRKQGQETSKIEQRTAQSIHLVDHNAIDFAGLDISEQLLQCWPVQASSAEPTIVVAISQHVPAILLRSENIRFRCLGLRSQALGIMRQST